MFGLLRHVLPFSLKGGCNKGLWLMFYLGNMLVLIRKFYVSVLGLPLYVYVFVWGYLYRFMYSFGATFNFMWALFSGMVAYGELD